MRNILFNRPQSESEAIIKKCTFVCVDLDECMFPSFSQSFVAAGIFIETIINPLKWQYLAQLWRGVVFMVKNKFDISALPRGYVMDVYERVMKGIPLSMFRRHSSYVHNFLKPYSLNVLRRLHEKNMTVMILSLTVQTVLNGLQKKLPFVKHCIGNEIEIDTVRETFGNYAPARMEGGADKLRCCKEYLEKYKNAVLLIIGHSEDEIPLAEYAREHGGLSIGINPREKLAYNFDVVLQGKSWKPLLQLL